MMSDAGGTFAVGRLPLWSSPLWFLDGGIHSQLSPRWPLVFPPLADNQKLGNNNTQISGCSFSHPQYRHQTSKTRSITADPKTELKMEAAKETVASILEQVKAALQTHGERLPQTLSDAKLVPGPAAELIPEGFRPTTKLEVSYDGKAVDLGNLFRVRETKIQPSISFQREVAMTSPSQPQ